MIETGIKYKAHGGGCALSFLVIEQYKRMILSAGDRPQRPEDDRKIGGGTAGGHRMRLRQADSLRHRGTGHRITRQPETGHRGRKMIGRSKKEE